MKVRHPSPAQLYRGVFKRRGLLMVPPFLFLVFCTWWETESEGLVLGVGGAVFAFGLALRVWAQMHLRYRLKAKMAMTCTGPYRYVRNPVYVGNILLLLGCCFLAELFWFAPIMLAYSLLVYRFVVRYEESHLLLKYGPVYREFLESVPRWLPRFPRPRLLACRPDSGKYLLPALLAEAHNVLLVLPFAVKEAM